MMSFFETIIADDFENDFYVPNYKLQTTNFKQ